MVYMYYFFKVDSTTGCQT